MVARELQHAPRDPRGFLRGLSEPWAIPRTVYGGSATPTPLADRLAWFWSARRTPKFWQRVPVGNWNSSCLALLRVGFGRKAKKGKTHSGQKQLFFALGVTQRVNSWLSGFCQISSFFSQDLPALASLWASAIPILRSQQIAARDALTFWWL